jgi:hypothetical protein
VTRRFILQEARHHPGFLRDSDGLSAHGFRLSFTPLPGGFSPFPHGTLRYRGSVAWSLGWWATQLPARVLVPGGTWGRSCRGRAPSAYGPLTLSGVGVRRLPLARAPPGTRRPDRITDRPTTRPASGSGAVAKAGRLDQPPVARRYWGARFCFSGPGTKMVQFPVSATRRVSPGATPSRGGGYPIRASGDRRLRTPPPSLSWWATPFFAPRNPRHPPCACVIFLLCSCQRSPGGPRWGRTTALALIRRALSR